MAYLDFDELSDNAQVCGRNATDDISMYQNSVSPRRASRHAGALLHILSLRKSVHGSSEAPWVARFGPLHSETGGG